MKKIGSIVCILIVLFSEVNAQNPNWPQWYWLNPGNTGNAGGYHHCITSDSYGNIWGGGYTPFQGQGGIFRFEQETNVFSNWSYWDSFLPDDRVNEIVFDLNGHIWVGTDFGIAYSDGENWTIYDELNTPFANHLQVRGMCVDSQNRVWTSMQDTSFSLSGGIGMFDGTWHFYSSENSALPTESVGNMEADNNGNIWIASNLGLIKHDGLNYILYTQQNSEISYFCRDVKVDNENRVWSLGGNSIDIFDGEVWDHIDNTDWPLDNFDGYSFDIKDDLILLSESGGSNRVMLYDGANWNWWSASNMIFDSHIAANGSSWVAGIGFTSKLENGIWTDYTSFNTGLSEFFNRDIFIDSQNKTWISNANGGAHVYDCPNWEVYGPWNDGLFPMPQNMSTVGTHACEAHNGDVWFTYDGVYGYTVQVPGGNYQNYDDWVVWTMDNAHPWFQSPLECDATSNGEVFFRTANGNTFMYDYNTNEWSLFWMGTGLTGQPTCMYPHDGKMYFPNYLGIDVYDNGTWSFIDVSDANMEWFYVYDMEIDNLGNMWLATYEGVWKFDGLTWTNWNESNSEIAANHVWAIEVDETGGVYIGAHETLQWPYYGGISIFDGDNWTSYLEGSSPVLHKQVEDIELDNYGNLWVLTQTMGLTIFNEDGLQNFFECIDFTFDVSNEYNDIPEYNFSINRMEVYPNPSSDKISLQVPNTGNENFTIEIRSNEGKLIYQNKYVDASNSQPVEIEVSEFPAAHYIITLITSDNEKVYSSFIKL